MLVLSVEQVTMSWVWPLPFSNLPLASTVKAAHDIYVWERAVGSLIKILEGPKEELIDVDVIIFQNIADFSSGILQNRLLLLPAWTVEQYINGAQQSRKGGVLLLPTL